MITINPAIQLGIADRVGSIEVGKDGDITIFDNHPLSIYAIPQQTIVDGVVRFDINDPDDMRILVDPEENISSFIDHHTEHHENDRCMQDVLEFFSLSLIHISEPTRPY